MPAVAACWLLLSASVAAGPTSAPAATQRVTFDTIDGVHIVGDYYAPPPSAPGEKSPCAILIHMYPATRASWAGLAPQLRDAGFAVLAYDIRGAGESTEPADKHLREDYARRATPLFERGFEDVAGAVRFLAARPECDARRLVLVGASVGCSIAIHYSMKSPDVRGLICLSPGTNYMGLKTPTHLRLSKCHSITLIAPAGEREPCEELSRVRPGVTVTLRPGGSELHGTRLLESSFGPELSRSIVEIARGSVQPRPQLFRPRSRPK
ncbi:MAG: alpha/beta fold hydrolase [Phycisphaerae bacterium]